MTIDQLSVAFLKELKGHLPSMEELRAKITSRQKGLLAIQFSIHNGKEEQ